jgi:hypothetical protein
VCASDWKRKHDEKAQKVQVLKNIGCTVKLKGKGEQINYLLIDCEWWRERRLVVCKHHIFRFSILSTKEKNHLTFT